MKLLIPKFKTPLQLLIVLVVLWLGSFVLHENYIPNFVVRRCDWPEIQHDIKDDVVNVMLITDPQLIDSHTYPGRSAPLLSISRHTLDIYLKKNYKALVNNLQPDYILWIGDLLDNGRNSTDEYFKNEVGRFNRLFYNSFTDRYKSGVNWFTNVPGNHDIGFGDGVVVKYRDRFTETFGKSNIMQNIHGVDFIMLDSLSLSGNKPINNEANSFIDDITSTNPRILLTHVPLYRDPATSCGPLRESKSFNVDGYGYQYKNSLDLKITESLLGKLHPQLIFSGDDHDYCDIVHPGSSREITVKSISMAMGIKYPAVQLLTFKKKSEKLVYSTDICFLQTPYYNIIHYVILTVFSGVSVIIWNLKRKYAKSILPTYKKVSKFLSNQEDYSSSIVGSTTVYNTDNSISLVKKFHVWPIVKHMGLLGGLVILLYCVVCATI